MKKVMVLLALIVFSKAIAQYEEKVEKFKVAFTTAEKLEAYDTESDSVVGFENLNYAVDFEVVPLEMESDQFKEDIKKAAYEIGYDMGFKSLKEGGKASKIEKSYYIIGAEIDDEETYPVIIMAIISEKMQLAYEITIYCYNQNTEEGVNIAKSFRFIEN